MDAGSSASRLRTIIVVDVITAVTAASFMVVVNVAVVRSGYLVVLTVLVAASGVVMATGLRPLGRGEVARALRWLALANWGIAIVAATVATFSWPLMLVTALLPSVLAASLVSGRELAAYIAASVAVSLAVVLVGLLQDFSGLSVRVDEWVRDTVVIITAPGLVGLVALMAWQNSVSLQSVLTSVKASRAELAGQTDELQRSRARVVAATDRERRRIERDLHDGAQQRLIGIGIGLSRAKALCESDPHEVANVLDALRQELRVAHDELRDLAQGVYPPVLTEHGLEAALQSAADRSPVPVTVAMQRLGRHAPTVEAALYFCCVEAMQNSAKHSAATSLVLAGGFDTATAWVSVTDDGVGFDIATVATGSGIVGMRDRLGSMGGALDLTSVPGRGTVVRCAVPLTLAPLPH